MAHRRPRREVRNNDDSFGKIKFTIPAFDGKYDPDAYLSWELVVDQKFACHDVPEDKRVRAATSEFTDFASVWWCEYCRTHINALPLTWDDLKQIMRARFVPSYYARDMLNKLQQLKHGGTSVEEYYQALQMGMLCCRLVEDEQAAMARFLGGLDREIYDILSYKEYNNMTRLFHYACKAEREVHGRRAQTRANIPAGRTPWTARSGAAPTDRSSASTSTSAPSNSNKAWPTPSMAHSRAAEVAEKPTKSASSVASTGRTRDVQCHQCKGFGHMQRDCPSKHVLVVKADGEYLSASDFDEDTLALLAANNIASKDEKHIGADVADQYESLIVQRVLSAQIGKAEQNQRHNLF
jgi:hypothetical protein